MNRIGIFFATICLLVPALMVPAVADSVRVVVNDTQITDTQISLRSSFLKLEGRGKSNSDRLRLARIELVEEALKLQEAKRIGVNVTEKQVDDAFLNIARNLKMSADKLKQVLAANGVNAGTLRDRLRASIAWQGVSRTAVAPRVQISDAELDKKAAAELDDGLSYDYLLKEVIFVIPQGSKVSASRRTAQANNYRKKFTGCDTAVELSLGYTDVAVLDVGRRHATQMPEALANELSKLALGGITKPRVSQNGVSMLAICSKTAARDLTFVKNKLRNEQGQSKLQDEADAYLERLKARAAISTR